MIRDQLRILRRSLLTRHGGLQAQRQVLELQQLNRANRQRIHTYEATTHELRREVGTDQSLSLSLSLSHFIILWCVCVCVCVC